MKKVKKFVSAFLALSMAAAVFCASGAFAAGTLKSDTTEPFSVGMGKNYTFKITASGTTDKPVVTVANGSALKVTYKGQQGNNYYYTVTAIGRAGSTSGVYMALPRQKAIRCCIVTVSYQLPADAASFNGHHYKIFDSQSSWQADEEYCENLGGHLATITSADENDFLYQYIQKNEHDDAYFGAVKIDGKWTWVDNEPFDYMNWADGEPNDSDNSEFYGMFYYKFSDGKWNDGGIVTVSASSNDTPFLCEWDK